MEIRSKVPSQEYKANFDRIFGKCPVITKTAQNASKRATAQQTSKGNTDARKAV